MLSALRPTGSSGFRSGREGINLVDPEEPRCGPDIPRGKQLSPEELCQGSGARSIHNAIVQGAVVLYPGERLAMVRGLVETRRGNVPTSLRGLFGLKTCTLQVLQDPLAPTNNHIHRPLNSLQVSASASRPYPGSPNCFGRG